MKEINAVWTMLYARWLKIAIPVLLAVVTFLFYYPSLMYGFIFDDLPTIVDYFYVRIFDLKGQFFANSRWISRLLNQFTYKYWQTNPYVYRIMDVMLHLIIGALIFCTLIKVFSTLKNNAFLKRHCFALVTLVTGLFLLHPVQTQTVTYITQMRLEGLVMLFVAAVLLTFTHAVKTSNNKLKIVLYALSLILTIFGAGTKEIVVALPFLLILFDWFLLAEGDWQSFKKRIPFHVVHIIIMALMLVKLGAVNQHSISTQVTTPIRSNRGNLLTSSPTEKITVLPYLVSQFKVIVHYMAIFFYPCNISFDYDMKLSKSFFDFDVIIPFFILLSILLLAVWLFIKKPNNLVPFCIGWFLVAILPRASIFPSTELVCDYKTYIASLGILLLIALGILYAVKFFADVMKFQSKPAYNVALLSLFILILGYGTKERNMVWSSELLFWKDVISKAPKKARAYNNYATTLWEAGKFEEAVKNYEQALACDDFYAEPHINLACIHQSVGRKDEALKHYQRALDIGEGHPELFHNLAILHMSNQNLVTAEACFKEAIALKPYYSKAYHNLGTLYYQQQRFKEALQCYENALQGDYQDVELYYSCGLVNHDMGNFDRALSFLEKLDKNYQDTAFLLGCCHYGKHRYAEAVQSFEIACNKDKKNLLYFYNYAQALLNARRFDEALNVYQTCLSVTNDLPFVPLHIAKCLYELGNKEMAIRELSKLVSSTKNGDVKRDGISLLKEFGVKKLPKVCA